MDWRGKRATQHRRLGTATMAAFRPALALMGVLCIAASLVSASFSDKPLKRLFREVAAPSPVDCQLSKWGEWSECDPCSQQKFRSRSIERFGQYGGRRCLESLGDTRSCKPAQPCQKEPTDCGNDFECDSGRCIKKRLVCNVDNDCGDFSDEDCETDPKSPCRAFEGIEVSELGRSAGNGVNILGMETRSNPFNNEYYNGICDRVRDGNTRMYYRKPWNVAALAYESKAEKHVSTEIYKTSMAVVTEIMRGETESFQLGLTFKTIPTEGGSNVSISGGAGLDLSKDKTIKKIMEHALETNKEFVRVKGKVQLGTFQMRSRENMLSDAFISDLAALPLTYDKGEYFGFLETFGTHYTVSGKLGGIYDMVYVLDSSELKQKDLTSEDVSNCIGYNLNVGVAGDGFEGGAKLDGKKCPKSGTQDSKTPGSSGLIKEIIPLVKGGTIDWTAKLNEQLAADYNSITAEDMKSWAASLVDAPVVIQQKPAPIYTLIPVKMQNAYEKKENLERAIEDYLDEFNVCKCQPCQNGGTAVLVDGECFCQCSPYFKGIACQNRKSEQLGAIPPVDGKWGCWSAWTACVNKSRTRRRLCNNPAPGPGGQPCQGMNIETAEC
ncbi:complement component C9 [Ambystoma mexicanum]|uniref:complement component C9 n=1 Tax=Ambystoma mexicanum TaxID=8296 RepID=UPI0037E90E24